VSRELQDGRKKYLNNQYKYTSRTNAGSVSAAIDPPWHLIGYLIGQLIAAGRIQQLEHRLDTELPHSSGIG